MKYIIRLHIIATFLFLSILKINGQTATIPSVVLKGKDGGVIDGKVWNSADLKGKINLLMYVDPDKQSWVKPLVDKLNSINYSPDTIGITFVVNMDATFIPDFLIRKKIKQKAKSDTSITYVLDQNKILVKKWKLKDENVNVLLIDSSGKIVYTHYGKITEDYLKEIIEGINESITI